MSKPSRAIIPYMRKSKFNYRKQLDNGGGALHSYGKIGEKPLCMASISPIQQCPRKNIPLKAFLC